MCLFLYTLSILNFYSCSSWFFKDFYVVEVEENFENSCVKVRFSSVPDFYTLVNSFCLTQDGVQLNGKLMISPDNKNEIIFESDKTFDKNSVYKLLLSDTLEDKNGVSLKKDFYYFFTEKAENEKLYVTKITPGNESNVNDELENILIEFSKPIDKKTFKQSFSITPMVDYFVEFNEEDKLKVIFCEKLKKNEIYQVKISKKLKDTFCNNLEADFESCFSYAKNFEQLDFSVTYLKPK